MTRHRGQISGFLRRDPCVGGHDVIRDSRAMWINDEQWVPARYHCIVCGYFWDEPTEKPSDPAPSRFHAE